MGVEVEQAWRQYQELRLEHYMFEMPKRHPSGDGKWAVGYTILRFSEEVQSGDRNSVQRRLVSVGQVYDLNTQDWGSVIHNTT